MLAVRRVKSTPKMSSRHWSRWRKTEARDNSCALSGGAGEGSPVMGPWMSQERNEAKGERNSQNRKLVQQSKTRWEKGTHEENQLMTKTVNKMTWRVCVYAVLAEREKTSAPTSTDIFPASCNRTWRGLLVGGRDPGLLLIGGSISAMKNLEQTVHKSWGF